MSIRALFILVLAGTTLPAIAAESVHGDLKTIPAMREIAPLERLYDGTVEAVNQATVSAQTNARVAEIYYDVNDYVEAGSPIIRFTDIEQQAVLGQAEASMREAAARVKEANEEFSRSEALFESGSGSRREYDRALAGKEAAEARLRAARSAVDAAKQGVDYTLIRAPYAGIVTERHVQVGEVVTMGQPLMSGLSLEELRVIVDLPQQVMSKVREQRRAAVLTDEGRVETERMTIFPFADTATNTFRVRVNLPPGQFALYPGMFVKVAFAIGDAERLLVPEAALVRRSEVTGVYVETDGALRLRQVRIGNAFGDRIEVLAGLSEGERVVTDPVRAAMRVKELAAQADAK